MEEYLIEQYNVIEDLDELTNEEDIKTFFIDNGKDYLNCGEGCYKDSATLICKIGDKFYKVKIEANIETTYNYEGYYVEEITSVEYKEVPKPEPKKKTKATYQLMLTKEEHEMLNEFLKEHRIEKLN